MNPHAEDHAAAAAGDLHRKPAIALCGGVAIGLLVLGVYDALTGGFASMYGPGLDTLGLAGFSSVGLGCYFLWSCTWRVRALVVTGFLMAYVGSYAVLSATGEYSVTRSGRTRWNGSWMAVFDQYTWVPRGVYWEPFVTVRGERTSRGTLPGYFYSPLIRMDRARVHPSQELFDPAPCPAGR